MNEQILENGRRKIARECRDKLKQLKKTQRQTKHSNTQRLPSEVSINAQRKTQKIPTYYVVDLVRQLYR